MKKYYLGFSSSRLKTTFSSLVLMNIVHALEKKEIPYTFSPDEDCSLALFPSAEDYFLLRNGLPKNIKVAILALNDTIDLFVNHAQQLQLSQDAYSLYPIVDELLVYSQWQINYLAIRNFGLKLRIVKPTATFDSDNVCDAERNAFRSFFRIPKERMLILSYGSYSNKKECQTLETIARLNPDKTFLFFGHNDRDFVKIKTAERMGRMDNIYYLDYLPSELYHSALLSTDLLLFTTRYLSFPNLLYDFMAHEVPIIAYKPMNFKDILNKDTCLLPTDFPSLYKSIQEIKTTNKAKEAKKFVDSLLL